MEKERRVLVVDDEVSIRKNVSDLLTPLGFSICEADNGATAIRLFGQFMPHVVILDINLPKKNGMCVLKEIKEITSDIPVIVFTAFGTSERAIEAMKLGAFDYIEKPFELDEFILTVERASDYYNLLSEVKELRLRVNDSIGVKNCGEIVGKNKRMKEIFKLIGRIAPTDATVLIQGESGTGKELIADAIQRHSLRSDKPYVKINCGALSESVLESEIFGHERGSFTGADAMRKGLFEVADGGTVYLDEINSMPQSLQVRLLRILQKQSFFRVGGVKPVSVDVRIIASSNQDVEVEKSKGNMREDLYYRLNVVRINIPPLRERKDDIDELVHYFLKKYSKDDKISLSPSSRKKLFTYSWPGNIRELENTIYRALVTSSDGMMEVNELSVQQGVSNDHYSLLSLIDNGMSFREAITFLENKLIRDALARNENNQTKTAIYLNMNRRQMYTILKNI